MNKILLVAAALSIAACSSTTQMPQEIEAVRDYIAAAELEEVTEIRVRETLKYSYVNDRYVSIDARRGDYLVEFLRNCWELRANQVTTEMVDIRRDNNYLRARFDTIRGCRISTIYEITEDQREELKALGDAPGDEVFLPDTD
jgi:hypothetical protein